MGIRAHLTLVRPREGLAPYARRVEVHRPIAPKPSEPVEQEVIVPYHRDASGLRLRDEGILYLSRQRESIYPSERRRPSRRYEDE